MDKEDRGLLALGLITAGILISGLLLVLQLQKQIRVVTGLRNEVQRETEAQARYEALKAQFETQRVDESEWRELLLADEDDVARFAGFVEQAATASGVALVIEFDDLPKQVELAGRKGVGLGLQLKLSGSYEATLNFVRRLEGSDYLIKQDKLQLSRQEGGEFNSTLGGVLIMKQP